ncbi:MAG: hypothetical protein U1F35_17715 [Steroidobacteraceae bacterium]
MTGGSAAPRVIAWTCCPRRRSTRPARRRDCSAHALSRGHRSRQRSARRRAAQLRRAAQGHGAHHQCADPRPADAPNVYVSVLAVRGRVAHPDNPKVPRGEDITALVDLDKPAYKLGIARLKVGWKPHRLDVAVNTDRPTYAVRAPAHVRIHVSRADGGALPAGAEVALAAVDEALLDLAPNRAGICSRR